MDYDFIIIGTGPSGSIVGSNLAKKGYKIAMVDRATNIKKNSDTNSFIFSPYINKSPFNYTPLFSNQLGGNSALWHNKIYLLSKKALHKGFAFANSNVPPLLSFPNPLINLNPLPSSILFFTLSSGCGGNF